MLQPDDSHSWALERYTRHANDQPRTRLEQHGYRWARELAEDEQDRRAAGPNAWWREPLTPAGIADRLDEIPSWEAGDHELTERDVVKAIAATRRRMFGKISMAAIRARARRAEQRAEDLRTRPRRCKECRRLLPGSAPRQRRYCDEHGTSLARVRRQRANSAPSRASSSITDGAARTGRGSNH